MLLDNIISEILFGQSAGQTNVRTDREKKKREMGLVKCGALPKLLILKLRKINSLYLNCLKLQLQIVCFGRIPQIGS